MFNSCAQLLSPAGSEHGSSRMLGVGGQHHLSLLNGGGTVNESWNLMPVGCDANSVLMWEMPEMPIYEKSRKCMEVCHLIPSKITEGVPGKGWANAHA